MGLHDAETQVTPKLQRLDPITVIPFTAKTHLSFDNFRYPAVAPAKMKRELERERAGPVKLNKTFDGTKKEEDEEKVTPTKKEQQQGELRAFLLKQIEEKKRMLSWIFSVLEVHPKQNEGNRKSCENSRNDWMSKSDSGSKNSNFYLCLHESLTNRK